MIDPQKLLEFVEKRAREANPSDAPLLVQHAIYEGLANRIKSGEFDYVVTESADFVMDEVCGDWPAPCNHDPAHEKPVIECPHWEPGSITLRTACTACEASKRKDADR